MSEVKVWAIFSQTHMVTLVRIQTLRWRKSSVTKVKNIC
jgi:hypothetical protein